jgi:uncharacterized OB-fold protein
VQPTPVSQPYWDGLRAEELLLQHCEACASWVFYPRIRCPKCLSDRLRWEQVDAHGRLYAFSVADHPTAPWFPADPPMIIAVVELEMGVRMSTEIVDADPQSLSIGMPVSPVFEHRDDVTLLKYRVSPLKGVPSD